MLILFSVQAFGYIYKLDGRIIELAQVLWSRIRQFRETGLEGNLEDSLTLRVMTLCIAGICCEYEDCDSKFSLLFIGFLPAMPQQQQEQPQFSYINYRQLQGKTRASQASILSTLSSMSLVHDMYKKEELGVLASKLEDLWMGVTFSHYMDVFVVPLVLTHGSEWSRSLDKLLFFRGFNRI